MANHIISSPETGLIASRSVPLGFTDATTIDNLGNFAVTIIGQSWVTDWLTIQTMIHDIAFVTAGGLSPENWTITQWNLFTDSEKEILSQFLPTRIPHNLITDSFSIEFLAECLRDYNKRSYTARHQRWGACLAAFQMNYTPSALQAVLSEPLGFIGGTWINSTNLVENYIDCDFFYPSADRKDFCITSIFDWVIDNYANFGAAPDIGTNTVADVVAILTNILVNGEY